MKFNIKKHPFSKEYISLHRRCMKRKVAEIYHDAIDKGVCDYLGSVDYLDADEILDAIKNSENK